MWLGGGRLGTVWRWWVPGLSCPLHWPSELWQEALLAAAVAGGDANDRTNALITTERERGERVNRGREGYREIECHAERWNGGNLRSDDFWVTAEWHDWAESKHRLHHHLLQQPLTQLQHCCHRERRSHFEWISRYMFVYIWSMNITWWLSLSCHSSAVVLSRRPFILITSPFLSCSPKLKT